MLTAAPTKIGKLRELLLILLREHEAAGPDGLPTSARFLYYELVARGVLEKHKPKDAGGRRSDQDLHDALMDLRESGRVPWDWIADETRSLNDYTGWPSIADWATTMVEHVRLDPWRGRAPLVLAESRSLAGALRKLARQYAVKLSATNGQVGGFLRTEIAPTLKPGDRVRYVGDFDWQGGKLDWKRIALTERQLEQYDLARDRIEKPDRRYKPVRHHPAVEAEALKQEVIVRIIRNQLSAELPESLSRVLEREARQRRQMATLLRGGRRS